MSVKFTIIIPTFNESTEIGKTLGKINSFRGSFEIIVVDGESSDNTAEIAASFGARVIVGDRGRGRQLHVGATNAIGDVLWFLHADSLPPTDGLIQIQEVIDADKRIVGGNFSLRFDGPSSAARFMNLFYRVIRHIGLLYGDSGIFVRRSVYRDIDGFKPLPLFEDLDFIKRLRKAGKLVRLPGEITTSSRRFEGKRFLPVFIRWVAFQCLYWIGVNPDRLAAAYYPIRKDKSTLGSVERLNNSR